MAISQALCTSFKAELLSGVHDLDGTDTINIALYVSTATLSASTTVYTTTGEVSSSGTNYATGGKALSGHTIATSGGTAYLDFADVTWASATITANGALIYNASQGNKAIAVLAFGGDKTSTNGDFTIQFPTADASNAIIRLA